MADVRYHLQSWTEHVLSVYTEHKGILRKSEIWPAAQLALQPGAIRRQQHAAALPWDITGLATQQASERMHVLQRMQD